MNIRFSNKYLQKTGRSAEQGFTIVELIVVIVVIAILASITAVSYKYLQTRAADTATAANVKQYVDALEVYAYDHGVYPAGNVSCLGEAPSDSYGGCGKYDYSGSGCAAFGIDDGSSAVTATWDTQLNDELSKYIGSKPNKVQISPYKTLLVSLDGCSVHITASAPTYTSAEWINLYENAEAYFRRGEKGRAYYIIYATSDGECSLKNSIKRENNTCLVYGGNTTLK